MVWFLLVIGLILTIIGFRGTVNYLNHKYKMKGLFLPMVFMACEVVGIMLLIFKGFPLMGI